jgi:hypothetical protein
MTKRSQYYIEGTAKSPEIDFNQVSGELILTGRSIPENAAKVYEPLLAEVGEYIKSPRPVTNFRLNLQYFNSASLIWFARIVKVLSKIENEDFVLFIHLYFDMEDFESMDIDEIRDIVSSLIDNIGSVKVSIGVKIYGTGSDHQVMRETTILT